MFDLSRLFASLPKYNISSQPEEPKGLMQRIGKWFKQRGKESSERADFIHGAQYNLLTTIYSGRTLRSPRQWHINWEVLRRMQYNHLVQTIVGTAVRELSGMKWEIRPKVSRAGVVKRAAQIRDFLSRPVPGPDGLTFPEWMKLILRDLFLFDAIAIEVIREDERKDPLSLKPIPGWQIEAQALPNTNELNPEEPFWRVFAGKVVAKYKPFELIYVKENPRTDSPYGISPLEAALSILAILLWADAFQLKNVSLNEVPQGILDLGQVPHPVVERFKLFWLQEVIGNPDKVIITNSGPQGLRWIPFRSENRAMQFRQIYDWYVRLLTACFGLRPQDVGLTEGLNRAVAEEMSRAGKRTGLYPRAMLIKEVINRDILEECFRVDLKDMEFVWLEVEHRDWEQVSRYARVLAPMFMTINEVRGLVGLPRAEGPLVDVLGWQAGPMAFITGIVPSEENKEIVDRWRKLLPDKPGVYQGPPPEVPTTPPVMPFGFEGATIPLEKVIEAVENLENGDVEELDFLWEKVGQRHLGLRLPVYKIEAYKDGLLAEGQDYKDLLKVFAKLEKSNPAFWELLALVANETLADTLIIECFDGQITFKFKGQRLEKEMTFYAEGTD